MDSPWHEALGAYFQPFLALFYPALRLDIDWTDGFESLDGVAWTCGMLSRPLADSSLEATSRGCVSVLPPADMVLSRGRPFRDARAPVCSG